MPTYSQNKKQYKIFLTLKCRATFGHTIYWKKKVFKLRNGTDTTEYKSEQSKCIEL